MINQDLLTSWIRNHFMDHYSVKTLKLENFIKVHYI